MPEVKIEKLAVLIDADNAQPSIVDGLLSEIAKYGTAKDFGDVVDLVDLFIRPL
jgi:hypothetical protein